IPSMVRALRSLLTRSALTAMRVLAQSVMGPPHCGCRPRASWILLVLRVLIGQGGEQLAGLHRILLRLVSPDSPIPEAQDSAGIASHVGLMGDHDDGDAVTVQVLEQGHDLHAGPRVESASGLVGQDEHRLIDERAGDGDTLLLAAGELRRVMMLAIRQ